MVEEQESKVNKNDERAVSYLFPELGLKGKVAQEPSNLGFSEQASEPCEDLISASVKWETSPCPIELGAGGPGVGRSVIRLIELKMQTGFRKSLD